MSDSTRERAEELYRNLVRLTSQEQQRYLEDHSIPAEVCAAAADLLAADLTEGAVTSADPDGEAMALLNLGLSELASEENTLVDSTPSQLGMRIESAPRQPYPRRRELGRGGMGAVYEVWDASIERPLAMKMLLEQERGGREPTPQLVMRFLTEAQITGQIDHPGVVPVHEIARDEEGRIYFTMQVVAGRSLKEILSLPAAEREKEGWTTTRLLDVILKVCETLSYAHSKGFVHRDLKPANIMVGQFGETYVMDWGLAKRLNTAESGCEPEETEPILLPGSAPEESVSLTAELTQLGDVLGTPMYMPPEQASGLTLTVDGQGDVYAVGAMLYEILAGHPPYFDRKSHSAREILAAVRKGPPNSLQRIAASNPSELIAISEKAMARSRVDRYETMGEMGDDVRAFIENRVVKAYRTGAVAELKKWVQRNRGVAAAGLIAVLVAAVSFTVVTLIQSNRNRDLANFNTRIGDEKTKTDQALAKERIALRRERSLVLAGGSARVLEENPASALLIALEANRLISNPEVHSAILNALAQSRELVTFRGCPDYLDHVAVNPEGTRLAGATLGNDIYIADLETGKRLAICSGHSDTIRHLAFSPDGQRLLSASFDGTAIVWDVKTGRVLRKLGGDKILRMAFAEYNSRGDVIVTWSQSGRFTVWNALSGVELLEQAEEDPRVLTGTFSPDGQYIVFGFADGSSQIVNLDTLSARAFFSPLEGGISHLAFSAQGDFVLCLARRRKEVEGNKFDSSETACYVWNRDGTLRQKLNKQGHKVTAAACSGDGTKIVTGFSKGWVRLWDAHSGEMLREMPPRSEQEIKAVGVNADGTILITTAGEGGLCKVWNGVTGDFRFDLKGHDKHVNAIQLIGDGKTAVTNSVDDTARLWSLADRGPLAPLASNGLVLEARLHPSGSEVLTRTEQSPRLELWIVPDGERRGVLQHETAVVWARYSSDGNLLVSIDEAGGAYVWEQGVKNLPHRFPLQEQFDAAQVSHDAEYLLTFSQSTGIVTRYRLANGMAERTVDVGQIEYIYPRNGREVKERIPRNALLSPGARYLVSWPHDLGPARTLRLSDPVTGEVLTNVDGHTKPIAAVNFGPGGDFLIASSDDYTVWLWNCADGKLLQTFRGHKGEVQDCWVSPDRRRVLTRSFDDQTTRLWNGESGEQIVVLGQNEQRVVDASFSALGSYLLTGFSDSSGAAIWSAESGKLKSQFPGGESAITSIEMSSDERWVLTVTERGLAQIWPVDVAAYAKEFTPRELQPLELDLYQVGTPEERAKRRSMWTLDRELETLILLALGVDGTPADNERVRPSYHRSIKNLVEAMPKVDVGDVKRAEESLLSSLKTLGKEDGEAHLMIARIQVELDRKGADDTIKQGLRIPGLDLALAEELKKLRP